MAQSLQGLNPTMGSLGPLFGPSSINQPSAAAKQWNPVASPIQPTKPQTSSNMTPDLTPSTYKIPGASFGSGSGGGSGSGPQNPYQPAPASAYNAMMGGDQHANVPQNDLYKLLFQGY